MLTPRTPEELAEALGQEALRGRSVTLAGCSSKRLMAGPVEPADSLIATTGLNRIVEFEPRDLTISVEAGLPWRELTAATARHRLMAPLDPPFAAQATVGGVIASGACGPRRRLYGTARDMVIGMKFATLEGKVVKSGGMVVKNVAGLDMAKLMIGSFGTLAAIATVNFKLAPTPEVERSFLLNFDTLSEAVAARNRVLNSPLQPAAIDLLNPRAAESVGNATWLLAVRAGGSEAATDRCERELSAIANGVVLDGEAHETLWGHVENFTPHFLERNAGGAVIRVSCTLKGMEDVVASLPGPVLARAGSGVCYGYFSDCESASNWLSGAVRKGWKAVVEFAPEEWKTHLDLWPSPGPDLELMKKVKELFDPTHRLNRGRLYGRI